MEFWNPFPIILGGGRGQQRSALRPFLTSALALRPFLTSPLSAQTLSFRSALHPFAISAQRSYLILDRRSALKTFISFQRSALKAIFQNRSALKDPPPAFHLCSALTSKPLHSLVQCSSLLPPPATLIRGYSRVEVQVG